ncbi:tetratricopeptide repeat protein [Bacteroidota bacterium]
MNDRINKLREQIANLEDSTEKIDLMNELSWLLRYETSKEGVDLAQGARKLAKKLKYRKGEAYATLNQAANKYLSGLDEEVVNLFMQALDFFEVHKEKEKGYVRVHNFLAMVYESFGDYETALTHAQEAVDYARKHEYKEDEGDALSTLGLIHNRLCDFSQSLDIFKKSLEIRRKYPNDRATASSLNLIARTLALSGDYESSHEYYFQSLELRQAIHDESGLPWTYIGLASLAEKQENYALALTYYERVLDRKREVKENRLELLCTLGAGTAHLHLADIANADYYLHKAMDLATEMKAKPMLVKVHFALSEYYETICNLEKALIHLKRYHELEREVDSIESRNRLKNQQIVFATEQSRKETEIYQLRNVELKNAFDEIDEKNREITSSIKYAERIQRAVLPPDDYLKEILPEYFIFFLPLDIVSGDFYWATSKGNYLIFTAADCTGHGIPGAFMSLLGVSYLNEIVNRMDDLKANKILNELRQHIMGSLHQKGAEGEAKDGMDMSICVYDKKRMELQFSGAYNPLYLIRNKELQELKADRMPIAIHHHSDQSFTNQKVTIKKNDVIYLFSDGFPDQFGGAEGKKYKYKQLKSRLLELHQEPMEKQKILLHKHFEEWKGDHPQIDDVIIIGIRF